MMGNVAYYASKGVLVAPYHYQFVLGVLGGMPATVESLVYLENLLPADATWSAFGIGRDHQKIIYATLALGGHIRWVFEGQRLLRARCQGDERLPGSSEQSGSIKEFGKRGSHPEEARAILSLPSKSRLVELQPA